ncbi:MAG: hypothetical protein KGM49_09255 [Sphingomonadales bacterium]|nr:hypothetical protein [Sphingomonadales bacterium]
MSFWQNVNPTGAIGDFVTVFKQAGPNRWRFAALAAVTTFAVFSLLTGETWKKPRALPEITYITSWPEHRTDAETQAFIKENQRRKEIREARWKEYDQVGQDAWMALGRASGINVDKIKSDADADKAKADADAKAKAEALIEPARKTTVER